jgi:hypothetical protein
VETLGNLMGKTGVKDKNCKGLGWEWVFGIRVGASRWDHFYSGLRLGIT